MDGLSDQLNNQQKPWTEAPPLEAITNQTSVQAVAQDMAKQIRNLTVALEYTGQASSGIVTAQVSPFQFGQSSYDDDGNFVDYDLAESFPYGTDEVLVIFDYQGIRDGQETIWKIYWDGVEDPSFRLIEEWSLGPRGSAEKPISYAYSNVFIFTPGEYTVELYVEARLLQRGGFTIEEPQ